MEDKVIKVEEEYGNAFIQDRQGNKVKVNTKTTYTHYESGRKDCHLDIYPLTSGNVIEKI